MVFKIFVFKGHLFYLSVLFSLQISISAVWGVIGAIVITLMPVFSEVWEFSKVFKENKVAEAEGCSENQHLKVNGGHFSLTTSQNRSVEDSGHPKHDKQQRPSVLVTPVQEIEVEENDSLNEGDATPVFP